MLSSLSTVPGSAAPPPAPPCAGAGVRAGSAPRCSPCAPNGSAPPPYFRCSSLQGACRERGLQALPRGDGVQFNISEQGAPVVTKYGSNNRKRTLTHRTQQAVTQGSWASVHRGLAGPQRAAHAPQRRAQGGGRHGAAAVGAGRPRGGLRGRRRAGREAVLALQRLLRVWCVGRALFRRGASRPCCTGTTATARAWKMDQARAPQRKAMGGGQSCARSARQ